MNWNPPTRSTKLDTVLSDTPSIAEAPRSILDFPAFHKISDPAARDTFENQMRIRERSKRYKSIDAIGNVWLIYNPWAFAPVEGEDWNCTTIKIPPRELAISAREMARSFRTKNKSEVKTLEGFGI